MLLFLFLASGAAKSCASGRTSALLHRTLLRAPWKHTQPTASATQPR